MAPESLIAHRIRHAPADWHDLSESERDRAGRYKIERVRRQYISTRAELKRQLAYRLNCLTADIKITVRPDGKPTLADSPLHFNVAHSGDWAVIAISDHPVGVDLEWIREVPNAGDLLKRFFTPREFADYQALPEEIKPAGFFRGWTCKEAVLKADGRGMRIIDACEIGLDPRLPPSVLRFPDASMSWTLTIPDVIPGYACAVANLKLATQIPNLIAR
jgi:4'-phosphopantetheinyl transferase